MTKFARLLSPLRIGPVEIPNRIIFTAHYTKLAEVVPSAELAAYYESRAAGGAGLIITEASTVHESGGFETQIVSDDPACIPGYRHIAERLHSHHCPVFGQLFHPGRETRGRVDGLRKVAWAPSVLPGDRHHVIPRQMPATLIRDVIQGYADAAFNMHQAGLDGVELLASHGYLMAQFLSPRSNLRDDAYGGDPQRRLRFVVETIEAVRERIGTSKVLGIRLSADSRVDNAASRDEMIDICRALQAHGGIDYFSFVVGSTTSLGGSVHVVPPMEWEAAYVVDAIAPLKAALELPVMVTGRINQPQVAERIIASGQADCCGMTRALIADPDLPNKTAAGAIDDIRACIACNQGCVGHTSIGCAISCIQHPQCGRELTLRDPQPAELPRQVLIVGGGPGGLKAAAVAAARGHQVTLYEREATFGGQVLLAEKLPSRAEFGGLLTNLLRECQQAGANLVSGVDVSVDFIAAANPDAVVLATGSVPYRWQLPGAEDAHVVSALDVIRGTANVGASVVIADWRNDWIGFGVAEMLAANGCRVRLCVNGLHAGETLHMYVRDSLLARIHRLGVEVIPYARLFGVDEDTVYFQHSVSDEAMLFEQTDTLVLTEGHQPDQRLELGLEAFGYSGDVFVIGDAMSARTAEEAIFEGFSVASSL